MKKQPKDTIQIGLRLDRKMLAEIEELSNYENIDKMSWIRRALILHITTVKENIKDEWLKEYLNLRLNEEDFKKLMKFKTIPLDLEKARKEKLNNLTK